MKFVMCLVLLTVLMAEMWSTRMVCAQSDCTNVLIGMAPCLYYITGNSSTPTQQCCNQLAYVVRSSPKCLCEVLRGGGSQFGISVNQTQALALPTACDVQTPPASRCSGDSNVVSSPAGSSNTSERGNGSKTISRNGSSSDGSYLKSSFPLLSFLSVASYITFSI